MRDEHCHILWGVDDGSRSLDESLAMLDAARAAGITQIVATPHLRWADFDRDLIQERFEYLQAVAAQRGMAMELGFEVYYKTLLKMGLHRAPEFVRQGTRDFLVEFNTGGPMMDGWEHVFYQLQTKYGLDITLAHPERYTTVLDNFDVVYRLADMGCRLQVSAMDLFHKTPLLSRSPLRSMAKCARRIVDEGLCDSLVSDAHNPDHYAHYTKALQLLG